MAYKMLEKKVRTKALASAGLMHDYDIDSDVAYNDLISQSTIRWRTLWLQLALNRKQTIAQRIPRTSIRDRHKNSKTNLYC